MTHNLHIYKASAGSGKTFTLAVNYICMLIENPKEYRHILAVTFTNKATAEMKQRILGKLYGIAHNTDDAIPYFNEVKRVTKLDEHTIRERAAQALALLVHDYSFFRIETIDSFFQSVLRGLARELELGTGMAIELDTRKVIGEAVDLLLRELKANDATLNWIQDYISTEIQEGKPWNITDKLKGFATNIHREDYQRHAEALHQQLDSTTLIKELRSQLGKEREIAIKRIEQRATDFFTLIASNGLSIDDFSNKEKGVCSYYLKIKKGEYTTELKGRVLTASQDPNGWTNKTASKKQEILSLASSVLIPHLLDTHHICCECIPIINTCDIVRHHLDQLQLINIIHERVLSLNKEANRFLLADTCQMLSRMQTGDSAFVFEKLGYYIRHIMIDEFQDTSRMQWDNFFPLLLEGLSGGHNSLLVGDVKQAIYRWRGSDWRILNEEVNEALQDYTAETHHLDTNRRSKKEIVRFNNHLFTHCNAELTTLLGQQQATPLLHAYSDVEQEWGENSQGGYVRITNVIAEEDETYKDAMCREVAAIIAELRESHICDEQIAILVRDNSQIAYMVDYMSRYHNDIRIFSAEAYLLEASTAVNMLISALRWINDSNHRAALVQLAIDYHRAILADGMEPADILNLTDTGYGLPEAFTTAEASLRQTPLYELAEHLYRLLNLNVLTHEAGYVMTFFDRLLTYCGDSEGDISNFLTYWDDELHSASVPAGSSEGIEAMTIHKSKGLEFHTVILPFCEWELNKYKTTLWVHSQDPLTGNLAILPIEYSAKMQESIFAPEHNEEFLKQVVDSYNLLYVACTRPRNNLFILKKGAVPTNKSKKKSSDDTPPEETIKTVGNLIGKALKMGDTTIMEFGDTTWMKHPHTPQPSRHTSSTQNSNPLEATATPIEVTMHSEPLGVQFRQSNQSKRYIASTTRDSDSTQQYYIDQGLLLHEVFSMMRTATEADSAIAHLVRQGIIDAKAQQRIATIVHHALQHPQAADWFSGKYELFNECNIIYPDAKGIAHNLRPDRVMRDGDRYIVVDFKFARPHSDHTKQVESYIELLHQMGHTLVEGYVWYGYDNKIIKV